jgi:hypothetical protein
VSRSVGLYRIGGTMEIIGFAPDGQASVAYSTTFAGSGGGSPYSFDFSIDPLVAGWTNVGGVVSNPSPSAGDYTLTCTMSDSARNVPVTQAYRFTINA